MKIFATLTAKKRTWRWIRTTNLGVWVVLGGGPYRVLLPFADTTDGLRIMGVLRKIVFPIFLRNGGLFRKYLYTAP